MELKARIRFINPCWNKTENSLGCDVTLCANERFGEGNFEKQSYALKLMDAEIQAAVQRVNDRLKSEGLTKGDFIYADPRCDEYGNVTSMREEVANKTLDKEELKVRLIE